MFVKDYWKRGTLLCFRFFLALMHFLKGEWLGLLKTSNRLVLNGLLISFICHFFNLSDVNLISIFSFYPTQT